MSTIRQEVSDTIRGGIEIALHEVCVALRNAKELKEAVRKYPIEMYRLTATISNLEVSKRELQSAMERIDE